MNPNMIGTSVEVVVNMAHHSPYNGITCHSKMTEIKFMKQTMCLTKIHTENCSLFLSLHIRIITLHAWLIGTKIEIDYLS